jgi:hypothetical protein
MLILAGSLPALTLTFDPNPVWNRADASILQSKKHDEDVGAKVGAAAGEVQ